MPNAPVVIAAEAIDVSMIKVEWTFTGNVDAFNLTCSPESSSSNSPVHELSGTEREGYCYDPTPGEQYIVVVWAIMTLESNPSEPVSVKSCEYIWAVGIS